MTELPHQRVQIDDDFFAIPLDGTEEASVRLALILRKEADPADGPFCRLRQLADGNQYLGCFIDRSGHVLKWLELWVRDYDNLAESLHENAFDIINNQVLDERWERQRRILKESVACHVYSTTLGADIDCPLYIDYYNKRAVYPKDEASQSHWKVCKEDNLLSRLKLAPYRTTVHRYLYLESYGADSPFLPITPNAPVNQYTQSAETVISIRSTLLPFNRYGGGILVREFAPMGLEGYLAVLGGKPWTGVGLGRTSLLPSGIYREVSNEVTIGYASGRLLACRAGSRRWHLESLFLKVRLFYEIIGLVKRCIEVDRKPFFTLETGSFSVILPNTAASSPFLWDAEVALKQSSDAVAFCVEKQTALDSRETTYYRTFRTLPASIYRPESSGQQRSIVGEVTLLSMKRDAESGLVILEGTLRSGELLHLSMSSRNLYFIDYPIRGMRLRMVGEMTGGDPQLPDKIRFQTRRIALNSEQVLSLQSFFGVEQAGVYCEILPVWGTPCDLYSLGVIGLEILYHGSGRSLAQIKDRVRTLAHTCMEISEEEPLVNRISAVLGKDAGLRRVLVPEELGVGQGSGLIGLPQEDLTWETLLCVIMRLQTGLLGVEGYASSFSNENNFRLSQVFEEPIKDLSRPLAILRSQCVGDVKSAHFIRDVIDSMLGEKGEMERNEKNES